MNWQKFQSQYPQTTNLLPSNFLSKADDEHKLKKAIQGNWKSYLGRVESLVKQSPAAKIAHGSYQNELHRKVAFSSFLSELTAYVVLDNSFNPSPADVAGGDGLPDLECPSYRRNGFDVEVTRLSSWDKQDNVVEEITSKFDGAPYTPSITWLDNFHVMPYTYKEIAANERFVEDILDTLQQVDPNNPPQKVENYGIEITFEKTGPTDGVASSSTVRAFQTDRVGKVEDTLRQKAEKQRGYRPLVIYVESELAFLDLIDLRRIVHGGTTSMPRVVDISSDVSRYASVWEEYMMSEGFLPANQSERSSYLREGNEGIFAESDFSQVAGVLFVDRSETCYYLPNFYTDNIEFRQLYENFENDIQKTDLQQLI
jgi:hypothetical protein